MLNALPDQINCVVFDFAGTLCSDRYFVPLGPEALDAIGDLVFGDNSAEWADPWMRGELTSRDAAAYLSKHLPYSQEKILGALHEGCGQLTFNRAVWEFAKTQRSARRNAVLVTANMDVFSEVVVPAHGLYSVFDVILNTADHGTLDKLALWQKAFRQLGNGYSFASSLLIEDSPDMVALFREMGGTAHQYVGDPELQAWLARNRLL